MSVQVQHRRDTTANVEANTPAAGELWQDTTKNEMSIGTGALAGGVRMAKKNIREILSPAQIAANTNDYSPSGLKHAAVLRVSSDASRNLTGLVPLTVTDSTDGRAIEIYNAGSFNLVVQDQNVASAAANRFDLGGADITLAPKQALSLHYSTALSRWELDASTAGAAVADGAISARKLATSSFGAFVGMVNGTLVPSVAASALTIALKTLAGADPSATDPVFVVFRNATASTGDFTVLTVSAATSLVISSGSSTGVPANNTAFKLWVVGFNDAGTFRLGAINCLSGTDIFPLAGWGIASSTAEGGAGAADNAQTFYTGVAVTSKAYTVLGYMSWESGLGTVGAWGGIAQRAQLFGPGVALPGAVVGHARTATGAVATGTTNLPNDNTIPQNTEGDQYMSKAITPSSAAHLLRISSQGTFSVSGVTGISLALFQDSAANALAAMTTANPTAGFMMQCALEYMMLAATSVATTFKIRAGSSSTMTFNGSGGGGLFNGVFASFLKIEEIAT